jgi:carboxyl-terminal processing protease
LEQSTGIRASKRKNDDDEDSNPESTKFPYGIEPTKLEAIHVIRDMIDLGNGAPATAKTEDKK